MNKLPESGTFSFCGMRIVTQVKRTDSVAMYSRSNGSKHTGFDVFKIVVKGDTEEFPPPHHYGKTAFRVKTVEEAEDAEKGDASLASG